MKYALIVLALLFVPMTDGVQAREKRIKIAASIPIPKPIPVEKDWENYPPPARISATQVAQTNPCPFPGAAGCPKDQGQQINVPTPPAGSPITVNIPPNPIPQTDNFLQYIWMIIISAIGTMFGLPQLKTAFGSQPLQLDASHPEVKKAVHDTLLQLIQSGVLQAPVQAGLGMIPGIGGVLAGLEPGAKQAILNILLGQQATAPASSAPPTTTALPPDFLKQLADTIGKQIDSALHKGAAT